MAFFTKGILLEQHKEPMLTRNVLVMRQEYKYFDCDFPDVPVEELSAQQIIEIARLAEIIDESDGLLLADKLEKANLGKTGTMVIDAVDDEPYVSSQMCMVLQQTEKLALAAQLAARAANPGDIYIAVYKHIFDMNINLPRSINDIRVERIGGLYPAEDRAYRHIPKGKNRLTVGACASCKGGGGQPKNDEQLYHRGGRRSRQSAQCGGACRHKRCGDFGALRTCGGTGGNRNGRQYDRPRGF